MMLSCRAPAAACTQFAAKKARSLTIVHAKGQKTSLTSQGFVSADNSGKSNIFPTQQKAFYSSPTTQAAAQQGLGGAQGGIVLAAALGVVAVATLGVLSQGSGETLNQLQSTDVESLAGIAERIAASL